MPKPLAQWNSARDVWETPDSEGLFCEHLDVFSETWPSSGMTRGGTAYALPTWAERTDGSESSSSPPLLGTPRASEWKGSGPVGSDSHAHMLARDYLCAQVLTLPLS